MKTRLPKILTFVALMAAAVILIPKIKTYTQLLRAPEPVAAPISESNSDFSKADVYRQSIRYMTKNYYDTAQLKPRLLLKEALQGVARSVPEILVIFPDQGGSFNVEVEGQKQSFKIPDLASPPDTVPVMQKVFSFIESNYHGETKLEDIEYAAVNGILNSLDPHSALLPPKIFKEFKTQTEGEFGGIGIVIGMKEGELTVIAPLPNTPAARAGLKSKDKIVKIGGEAAINMNLTEAVEKLRGKIGTQVALTVSREGADGPLDFNLTRAIIKIESVQSKLISLPDGDIGVLKIKSFQEETLRELNRHLALMRQKSKNFKGLILDFRNNPGGLLNQAIDIADKFLEQGTIVLTVGANNQILETDEARAADTEENYPIVAIVNDGSASASEIVAGALKNNNRGVVIGTQTFGKGSVQSVYALKDGSALKLTVAQYLTPGKQSIQSVGITPDVKLYPRSVQKNKVDLVEAETFGEKDLEKHLESSFKQSGKPVYTLGYYQANPPDPEDKENDTDYNNEIQDQKDFEIQLAEKIILSANNSERQKVLSGIEKLIESSHLEEDQKVEKALQEIAIDWSSQPVNDKPQAVVTFNVISSSGQVLQAGEEVKLELQVRNDGKAAFQQLIAVTESENFLLKNREFVFGKIAPGETKTWTVPIKIPSGALRREDKVTFSFREGNNNVPEKFETLLKTQPLNNPNFAYKYEIHDDGQYNSRGNGDGKIDLGEKISLRFNVNNQGTGESKKTVINLKNLDGEGVFINKGREKLDILTPGTTKEGILGFSVDKTFAKDKIELEFSVEDSETMENLKEKMKFPIGQTPKLAADGKEESAPRLTLDPQSMQVDTKQKQVSIKGKVEDPSGLKDISVYVGDYKAYLKTFSGDKNSTPQTSSDFTAELTLKERDNNLITVMARDLNNLVTRESFFILQE